MTMSFLKRILIAILIILSAVLLMNGCATRINTSLSQEVIKKIDAKELYDIHTKLTQYGYEVETKKGNIVITKHFYENNKRNGYLEVVIDKDQLAKSKTTKRFDTASLTTAKAIGAKKYTHKLRIQNYVIEIYAIQDTTIKSSAFMKNELIDLLKLAHSLSKEFQGNSNVNPIILLLEKNTNKNSGLVIGGVKDGKLLRVEDFLYEGKSIDELDIEEKNLKSNLIMNGYVINIYNLKNEKDKIICESVDYSRDNIDSNHFVWANFRNTITLPEPFIGMSCGWNPLPRTPQIDDKTIKADIDGNGTIDKIEWESTETNGSGDINSQFVIRINYNGKDFSLSKNSYGYRNSKVGLFDINGDNKMELVVYTADMGNSVSIYSIEDKGFIELLNFSIYGGS